MAKGKTPTTARKLAKKQVTSTPAGPAEPVQETAPATLQAGGSKKKAKKPRKAKNKQSQAVVADTAVDTAVDTVVDTAVDTAVDTEAQVQTELATNTETNTETVQEGGARKVRSFKVRLPDNESFEGRFTGLTPYQAANKALSKYYRETKTPKKKIRFTIRESTRGSKRNQYTYNGQREKLTIPVEYAINDGRIITKNYKNKLTKIKKAELAALMV